MNVSLISFRFARALFDFAASAGEEETVLDELKLLKDQLQNITEFNDTLMSPIVPQETKLKLLKTATGKTCSYSLQRFFNMLLDHKRENILLDICHSYKLVYEKEKGFLRVRITTAVPLDKERSAQILEKLEKSTGRKIELTYLVQPDIIGGYVLTTDEKRLDASVKTRLMNVRKNLTI